MAVRDTSLRTYRQIAPLLPDHRSRVPAVQSLGVSRCRAGMVL
jgi:hypothetical protein